MLAHRAAVAALALAAAATGCAGSGAGGKIVVVAAFHPLAEVARHVGGDAVAVHDLTPAGAEPHDLELRPSDFARVREADLVVYLGGGFQPALEDALRSASGPKKIDVLAAVRSGAGAAATDPHVWLDPVLFEAVVDAITAGLRERAPPDRARQMEQRHDSFTRELEGLHSSFEDTLKTCRRRQFVTTHDAFGHLARRYGLEQIAITGLSPESEPSPRRLEEVTQLARRLKVTTIYFEELVSPRVAQAVARSVGARTAVLNPIEGLTREQREAGEGYISLMRQNLRALADGLGCTITA